MSFGFGAFMQRISTSPFMPSARTWLMVSLMMLMTLSLLMVASASVFEASTHHLHTLHYFWSQLIYMAIAVAASWLLYQIPLKVFENIKVLVGVLAVVFALLLAVLLFAHPINGSKRWLFIAGFSFQPAEFAKFWMVFIVAEYVKRRSFEVRHKLMSIFRMIIWYLPLIVLLYFQPDYGSIVMLLGTMVMMFLVAGVPASSYAICFAGFVLLAALGFYGAEYRRSRILSFWDPFDDVQDTDYQLSRSLVSFGRGEVSGVGYSNGVFKLGHLPEAHTDFILAVTAEELGFLGVSLVLLLELIIITSIMRISYNALVRRQARLSYTCFGFAVLIFGQTLINAGMNMGLLPPKGLTLPFFSYGGSAMLFFMMMIAIVLKIDAESPKIFAKKQNRDY